MAKRLGTNTAIYNASGITLSDGESTGLFVDASGNLLVSSSGGSGGTVTANAGTNLNTSALALESGGNLASVVANQTNGTQQSKLTNGTNVADIAAGDSGQNSVVVSGARKEVSYTTTTVQAVGATDVSNYRWVSVRIGAQGTGSSMNFQGSNDNANWVSVYLFNQASAPPVTADNGTAGTGIWAGPLNFRYFRLNVLGISAGTTSGLIELFSQPASLTTKYTIGTGTKTNNNAAPGSTNMGALTGIANAAAPSWTEGNEVLLSTDLSGNLRTIGGLFPAGTVLNTYSNHIITNTTNTPTSSTAYISCISISSEVAGTTSTVTIQDKQGTPLKLVNGLSTTTLTTIPTVVDFQTPVKMVSGIDIVTAGAVAATVDVWINYYQ